MSRWITATSAALLVALLVAVAGRASGGVAGPLPPASWVKLESGPAGGTVWSGVIPNPYVAHERPSAVYLPPSFSAGRRYPVLYLLHGLRGSPASYTSGLRIGSVLDSMIASRRLTPMIVVIPAGANSSRAEWAGAWDSYVIHGVVPWVDAHLPTIASPAGRALAGLCAGGYGAMDIGLRHPNTFGALESWEGYFAPVFRDGPFLHASKSFLAANNPTLLVQQDATALRHAGIRFYVSVGGNHGQVLRQWSLSFVSLLGRLGLPHTLWQMPKADTGHFWRATLPSALGFASGAFQRKLPYQAGYAVP